MPSRVIPFIKGQVYHIYNRGTEKRRIFEGVRDFQRFFKTLLYYQLEGPKPRFSHFIPGNINLSKVKIVEIIAYCLMPNHFHLLLKANNDQAITELISKLSNSYTKYFNTKYRRVGPLLQGEFKSVLVESDEQLIHLSRYIHLNPLVSHLVKDLNDYHWFSYKEYTGLEPNGICLKETVLSFFKNPKEYEQFVLDHADYASELELIKHQILEGI